MDGVSERVWAADIALRSAAVPGRADHERGYLRSELEHYGCPVPAARAIARRVDVAGRDDLLALVEALWVEPVHERRMLAVMLLVRDQRWLQSGDVGVIERLLRECRTWALLDELAIHVAGPLLTRHPAADRVLDRWATDDDFWIRRAALLAHLLDLRAGGGDWERFTRLAEPMLADREFFIRKAIGWVLRDTGRRRPELVAAWIVPRAALASGVTLREVRKVVDLP